MDPDNRRAASAARMAAHGLLASASELLTAEYAEQLERLLLAMRDCDVPEVREHAAYVLGELCLQTQDGAAGGVAAGWLEAVRDPLQLLLLNATTTATCRAHSPPGPLIHSAHHLTRRTSSMT